MRGFRAASRWALGGVLAGVLLAGGCSSDSPDAGPTGAASSPSVASPTPSGTAAPSPSWSGTESLGPEQLEAFEQATATVLAYRQTIVDLYSGARTDLNDLYLVATGDLVDQNLRNIQKGLGEGQRVEPKGAQVHLMTASPQSIDLDAAQPKIVVRACIDSTSATAIAPDGSESPGKSELSDYTVSQAGDESAPRWGVTRIQADRDEVDRAC